MRKTKSGTRNKQDWSTQDYSNQRRPVLTLLAGNVRTSRALIVAARDKVPDSVARKIDIAEAALIGLLKIAEELAKIEK